MHAWPVLTMLKPIAEELATLTATVRDHCSKLFQNLHFLSENSTYVLKWIWLQKNPRKSQKAKKSQKVQFDDFFMLLYFWTKSDF